MRVSSVTVRVRVSRVSVSRVGRVSRVRVSVGVRGLGLEGRLGLALGLGLVLR